MSNLQISGGAGSFVVVGNSAVPVSVIEPAATFTSATPADGGSGTIALTSGGAHGFTSAVAVGYPVYISGGTGWTPGFYPVAAVPVDTTGTAFSITGTFDAGMGAPTIALANTEVTLASVPIPILRPGSIVKADPSWGSPNSVADKTVSVYLDVISFSQITLTSSPYNRKVTIIQNRGVTNSQVSGIASAQVIGVSSTGSPPRSANVDTSIPTILTFTAKPAIANVPIVLDRYIVEVYL